MIPKHDQTAFSAVRQDKPQANIFEVKKACRKGQKMQKMIPKRDHILLWSSFFVTLVAKKYRLATMLPFVPRMVCDSR